MGNIILPETLLNGTQYNKRVWTILNFLNDKNVIDTSAPILPYIGQEYYDKTNKIKQVWDGQVWQEITGPGSSPTFASLTVTNNIVVGGTVDGLDLQAHNHSGANQGGTVAHGSLGDHGTNTHATIDTHLASTSNPHSTTKAQVGLTNVTDDAQVKRSEYTAKGNLLAGTGAGTFSALAVGGTNGHVLQVDSTTETGMKWAPAPSPATVTLTDDSSIATTKKFYLDGGGNTYIIESASDVITLYRNATATLSVGADLGIVATSKLYLDGVARSGDTYIYESGANVLDIYVGGVNTLKSSATLVSVAVDLAMTATKKVILDGAGASSYIVESADNVVDIYVGGTKFVSSTTTVTTFPLIVAVQGDLQVTATKKVLLDGSSGHTYLVESADGTLDIYAGAVKTISSTATVVTVAVATTHSADVTIVATKKLLLTADAGTYLIESADNVLDIYVGATKTITSSTTVVTVPVALTVTGVTIHSDDVKVAQNKKIILDTDLHSYITCAGADVMDFYTAGSKRLSISATGVITDLDGVQLNNRKTGWTATYNSKSANVTGTGTYTAYYTRVGDIVFCTVTITGYSITTAGIASTLLFDPGSTLPGYVNGTAPFGNVNIGDNTVGTVIDNSSSDKLIYMAFTPNQNGALVFSVRFWYWAV